MDPTGLNGLDGLDGHSPPNSFNRKSKLGYTRISVACTNCRKRKIRCERAKTEPTGRCANCIKLRKDCVFASVDNVQTSGPDVTATRRNLSPHPASAMPRSPSTIGSSVDPHSSSSTGHYGQPASASLPTLPSVASHPDIPAPSSAPPSDRTAMPHQEGWAHPGHAPYHAGYHLAPQHAMQWSDGRGYAPQYAFDDTRHHRDPYGNIMTDGQPQHNWPMAGGVGPATVHSHHHNSFLGHDQHQQLPSLYQGMHGRQAPMTLPSQPASYYGQHQPLMDDASTSPSWDGTHSHSHPSAVSPRHDSVWPQTSSRQSDQSRHVSARASYDVAHSR